MIYNIATGKSPQAGFIALFRKICEDEGVPLKALTIVDGPGCCNIGIMLAEPNDRFVEQLTMILMPAKYETLDSDPSIEDGLFQDLRTAPGDRALMGDES